MALIVSVGLRRFLFVTSASLFCIQMSCATQFEGRTMQFYGQYIFNTSASWYIAPASLEILNCTETSITVHSDSPCCTATVLKNSSCEACSQEGRRQCVLRSQSTYYSFNESMDDNCNKRTRLELECLTLTCQEEDCPSDASVPPVTQQTSTVGTSTTSNMATLMNSPEPHGSTTSNMATLMNSPEPHGSTTSNMTTLMNSLEHYGISTQTMKISSASRVSTHSITVTLEIVTVYDNSSNSTFNETSTESPFDIEQSKKDFYTFLGVFGAAFVVVMIIVCAFFIRKNRTKVPIVDISDEFWSSNDYISDPIEGNFCPGSSYSVINPVYNSKPFTVRNNGDRFSPSFIKTETVRPSYTSHAQQIESDYDLEPVAAHSPDRDYRYSTDDEAGVVMDLTTMVTKEIKKQQMTKDMKGAISFSERVDDGSQVSLSGHYRKGKRHRESRQRMRHRSSRDSECREQEIDHTVQSGDIYALAYKNRFHECLDQCSAEESDV